MRFAHLMTSVVITAMFVGCNDNPFPDERVEYAITFVIDRSSSYDDYLASSAYEHVARVKQELFQDLGGRDSTILVSQINGQAETVLFEGSPQTFEERFPTKDAFLTFVKQSPTGSSPVFQALADTLERLCRRHEQNRGMRSIVLVYSDMEDNHGGKDRFDAALRRISQFPTAIGIYGAAEGWQSYLHQCGVRTAVAYDRARVDPPLPQIP